MFHPESEERVIIIICRCSTEFSSAQAVEGVKTNSAAVWVWISREWKSSCDCVSVNSQCITSGPVNKTTYTVSGCVSIQGQGHLLQRMCSTSAWPLVAGYGGLSLWAPAAPYSAPVTWQIWPHVTSLSNGPRVLTTVLLHQVQWRLG